MRRQEIISTDYSELVDMITCLNIYNGAETPEQKELGLEDSMGLD